MSVRRADQQGRSTTPALPPTLFRLRDLNQRSTAPFDSPLAALADPDAPTESVETDTATPHRLEGPEAGFADAERGFADTTPVAPPQDPEDTGSRATLAVPATQTSQGSTTQTQGVATNVRRESPQVSKPANSPASVDQPAGREWMEMLGSNKGITTMLVLVLIAAWWTRPQDGSDDGDRSGDASSLAQTENPASDNSPTFDPQDLDFDLNDGFEVASQSASPSEVVSSSPAPSPATGFDSSAFDTSAFDPAASAAHAFDASAFGDPSAKTVAHASSESLPPPPTFSPSQVPAQTVATRTQQGLNGALQEMASNQSFGIAAPDSNVQAPSDSTSPSGEASGGMPQTSSPNRVDWSRYFPPQP